MPGICGRIDRILFKKIKKNIEKVLTITLIWCTIITANKEREQKKMKEKMYSIVKVNSENGKETNYGGGYTEKDVKQITKGYTFNGLFYTRKNSKYMYIATEVV